MKLCAPFLGAFHIKDPFLMRDYVQAVEGMGFTHLFADEILLDRDPDRLYHETMTLFAYLAAVTEKIRLVTGIMVLPKRQTLLLARQAAEVDFLSGGRLRLGVGVGWNQLEFESLGIDFRTRGKRIEEQIQVLNQLWMNGSADLSGEFHRLTDFEVHLPPHRRPIPIWVGGTADSVLRRAARMADGWIADESVADKIGQVLDRLRSYLDQEGRNLEGFRLVKYLLATQHPRSQWGHRVREWEQLGITHTVLLPSVEKDGNRDLEALLTPLQVFLQEAG
jgi:probable F420-dependent oxidoreductase